jgi:hypothetical protein
VQLRVVIDVHRHHRSRGDIRWLYFFTGFHKLRLVCSINVNGLVAFHHDEDVLAGDLFQGAMHRRGRLVVGSAGEVAWGIRRGAPPHLGIGAESTED